MLQIIKCPSCAAPLEFDGDAVETCEFCGSRVVMRPDAVRNENSFGFGRLLEQAQKLKEILHLARSGNKIQAVKLYRETFGVSLAEAKEAVEKLERGESVSFQNVSFQSAEPIKIDARAAAKTAKSVVVPGLLIVGLILIIVAAFLGVGVYSIVSSLNSARRQTTISPPTADAPRTVRSEQPAAPLFAKEVLRFGGEGVGAGMFKDNRAVAVDGDGRIYSVDYTGGRVQVFDADGKFLTQWFVDKEYGIFGLEAGRNGAIYINQAGKISAYEATTGKLITQTERDNFRDIAVGLDGSLTAIDLYGSIHRFDKDLKSTAVFKDAAKSIGVSGGFDFVAVNGLGEIFAATRHGKEVCKFSADGKFIDRFKTKAGSANDIAVDPKGRVFVSDTNQIYVYSPDGEFINQFETRQSFGMTFNDRGEIFVASRPFVVKYQLQN